MVSSNKKRRKNQRNNKKNKIKRENQFVHSTVTQEDQNVSVDDHLEAQPTKRRHIEEDSDTEVEPKRKKKKKQPVQTESDKKGHKSIRQMKREKHAQKLAAEAAAAKDQLKSQCVSYLSQWKHDRQNWKFMKAKQVWLYKNKFSSFLLPDSSWPVFLEYFESAKGNIRNLLLEDANKIINQMDEWIESQNSTEESNEKDANEGTENEKTEPIKPDETAYKRARDLIQCLQE